MQEFIEELKHNQKINYEKGLENRVNIDYVIERLEFIEKVGSFNYVYENDNGIIGNIENVIEYIDENELIDLCDYEHILIDLYDIQRIYGDDVIVRVTDNNGMDYSIDYWEKEDIVKVGK